MGRRALGSIAFLNEMFQRHKEDFDETERRLVLAHLDRLHYLALYGGGLEEVEDPRPTKHHKLRVCKKIGYLIRECVLMREGATHDGWLQHSMRVFQAHLSSILTFVENVDAREGST